MRYETPAPTTAHQHHAAVGNYRQAPEGSGETMIDYWLNRIRFALLGAVVGDYLENILPMAAYYATSVDRYDPDVSNMEFKPSIGAPIYVVIHVGKTVEVNRIIRDVDTNRIVYMDFKYKGQLIVIPECPNPMGYFRYKGRRQ